MAYFEVVKTITETNVIERRQRRDKSGNVSVVESIRVVHIKPGAYGHEDIKVGQVLEINAPFDIKARGNTDFFKEVKEPVKDSKKEPKKKK